MLETRSNVKNDKCKYGIVSSGAECGGGAYDFDWRVGKLIPGLLRCWTN